MMVFCIFYCYFIYYHHISIKLLVLESQYQLTLNSFYAAYFQSYFIPNFQFRLQGMNRIYQSLLLPLNLCKYGCLVMKQKMSISKLKDRPYGISTVFQRQELMQITSSHSHQLYGLLTDVVDGKATSAVSSLKLQNAEILIRKIQQVSQDNQKIHLLLAKCFVIRQNYQAAIREYNKAWKLSPNSSEYCIYIAICLMECQNYYDAIKLLQKEVTRHEKNAQIYHHLAIANLKLENYRQAILSFYKSYKLDTEIDKEFIQQGKSLLSQQKYYEALPFFIKWAIHHKDEQQALNGLNKILINSEKLEEAKQLYHCLGQIEEYQLAADHSLGLLYFDCGNIKQAKKYLCSVIKSKPDNFLLNLYLGTVNISEDQFTQAIFCLQKCLKIHPNDANVLNSLALIYMRLSQLEKALYFYQQSVKANEKDSMSWYGLGVVFLQKNQVQEGIKHLKKAIELDQNNYPALEKLGNTLYLVGDEKQANALLIRARKAKQNLSRF